MNHHKRTAIDKYEESMQVLIEGIRPDEAIRPRLDIGYTYEKSTFILNEIRPHFMDENKILYLPFAKVKYVKSRDCWKIFWMRASGKWEGYRPFLEAKTLEEAFEVIDDDAHGCFKG